MRGQVLIALAGLLLAAGCQRENDGKPAELAGRLFVFNYRVASATYLVTMNKTGTIPEGATAVAEFEDPAGGAPIVVREAIFPAWDKISLQSPNIRCIVKDRPYAVTILILDAKGATLQELTTQLVSDVDQSVLPGKPLVIGPGYDRNPEVFKPDGSTDYARQEACRK